jgi:hypothetical protein
MLSHNLDGERGRLLAKRGFCVAKGSRLDSPRVVPTDAEVQIHPAALPFDLVDLALAVVLTTGLERQQLSVPRERLERGQHVSYSPPLCVAQRTLYVALE